MRNLLAMLGLWGGRAAESVPHGEAASSCSWTCVTGTAR